MATVSGKGKELSGGRSMSCLLGGGEDGAKAPGKGA
jgi:hypothetical protein